MLIVVACLRHYSVQLVGENRDGFYCCELTTTMKMTQHSTLPLYMKAQGSVFCKWSTLRTHCMHRDTPITLFLSITFT